MKLLITTSLLIISISLFSQNDSDSNKNQRQHVIGDTLLIYFGETLYFEMNMSGNKILDFKQVDNPADPNRTLQISLEESGFGGKGGTMLKITNPFDKPLKYKAQMKIKGRETFIETSVVPVYPKIFSMEMWPERLDVIRLSDFKLK